MRIGYFCLYTPIELLKALSFKPIRLIPEKRIDKESRYFRYDACPFLKNLCNQLIDNKWEIESIFLLSLCDGQRRLGEILKREMPNLKIYEIYFPRTYNLSAFQLYYEAIKEFIKEFERDFNFLNKRLKEEIEKLNKKKKKLITIIKNLDFQNRLKLLKDFWENQEIKENFITSLKINEEKEKILLVGSYFLPIDWQIIEIIEKYFTIASDALCPVSRGLEFFLPISNLENYLFFYFSKIPCILRRPNEIFYKYLKRKIEKEKIKKVILYTLKFCDGFSFEKDTLRNLLKLPALAIESDYSGEITLQIETRIAAFYES